MVWVEESGRTEAFEKDDVMGANANFVDDREKPKLSDPNLVTSIYKF